MIFWLLLPNYVLNGATKTSCSGKIRSYEGNLERWASLIRRENAAQELLTFSTDQLE